MIINEKGLARQIKRAYKRAGYTIRELEGDLCIYTADWFIRVPWRNLPKKALGAIAEHVGYDFAGATALHIAKDLEPQILMDSVADEDVLGWVQAEEGCFAKFVPVTIGMRTVLQGNHGICFGINSELRDLLEEDAQQLSMCTIWDGCKAAWNGDGECLIVNAYRGALDPSATESEKAIWNALERIKF